MPEPFFSVLVPTYHWPEALAIALESVRLQSFTDFEVLVTGDGCTDETAQVVAALQDPRFHWKNLDRNHGSQWAANNDGLSRARGRYIAYLGHDDVWHPDHLKIAADRAQRTGAPVLAATGLMAAPPHTRTFFTIGIFPGGRYHPTQAVPPSALIHARELAAKVKGWRDPNVTALPVDIDFFSRLMVEAPSLAALDELTLFKFTSSWRWHSYRRRDVTEQKETFAQLFGDRETRDHFIATTWQRMARAAVDGLLRPAEITQAMRQQKEGRLHNHLLHARGLKLLTPLKKISELSLPHPVADPYAQMSFEWHAQEKDGRGHPFRWSGPSTCSGIELPVIVDEPVQLRIPILAALHKESLALLEIECAGQKKPGAVLDNARMRYKGWHGEGKAKQA